MSRLTREGAAEPVSRDQILRRERGQGNIFAVQLTTCRTDSLTYPVDPYCCYMCDHTYTYILGDCGASMTREQATRLNLPGLYLTETGRYRYRPNQRYSIVIK